MEDDETRRNELTALAETFPTLKGAPGVNPWKPHELNRWAGTFDCPNPARFAARFVLDLANPEGRWSCGPFEVFEAVLCWDEQHRRAFQAWVNQPLWP